MPPRRRSPRDPGVVDAGVVDAVEVGALVDASPLDALPSPPLPRGPIDLADYGLDPTCRAPSAPPATAREVQILDAVEQVARRYAEDLPRDRLDRSLGRPLGPIADRVRIAPADPRFEAILVTDDTDHWAMELQLIEPVTPRVLAARFGELEPYLTDEWGGPSRYGSPDLDRGRGFAVMVVVVLDVPPWTRRDQPVRVVYLERPTKRRPARRVRR